MIVLGDKLGEAVLIALHSPQKEHVDVQGKYRCKDGTEKWEEGLEPVQEGKQEQLEAFLSGVISRELEQAIQKLT